MAGAHKILWTTAGMDRWPRDRYIAAMTIGTRLFTWLKGLSVGQDSAGNRYYQEKRPRAGIRSRRWVIYAGAPEASTVPPEWHSWLHHTTDAPLASIGRKPWQKPHVPNLTGSVGGYRPAGHDYSGGRRAAATGDYEAWTPGS